MGAEKIGGFQDIGQRILNRFRNSAPVPDGRDRNSSGRTADALETRTGAVDRVEISRKAREMSELREAVTEGRESADAAPSVRPDRIAEVKSRLDRGYYQSPAVNDKIAGRLEDVLAGLDKI